MKLRIVLPTATAIGLLLATGTQAADPNTVYLTQDGSGNTASIDQSHGAGGNDIGSAANPVLQSGDDNTFHFDNVLSGSGSNDDIEKAQQLGDRNYFSTQAWNGANNNVIQDVTQDGNDNRIGIGLNGPDNGVIGTILQDGNANQLVISQSGSYSDGNTIGSVTMTGDNNGLPPDANGAAKRAGVFVYQSGDNNTVSDIVLEGSDNINPYTSSADYRTVVRIEQRGNDNGQTAAHAAMYGSFQNRLWVLENGDGNNFWVETGNNSASTGNSVKINQGQIDNPSPTADVSITSSYNDAHVTQYGDYNQLVVTQFGDGNSTTANFIGDFNGNGSFTGGNIAANLEASNVNLTQGTIYQDSQSALLGNSVDYEVTGSSNLFAFAQIGGNNTITGQVNNSSNNQVAVLQTGDGNTASFTQAGVGMNVAAISQ